MLRFTNIIFDLDGLIVDTEPIHQRAFNLLLEACGTDYRFTSQEYGRLITGRSIFENSEYVRERFSLPQTAPAINEAHRAIFNLLIGDAENLETMPGLDDLMHFLAVNNIRTAVASSSRPEQVELILRGINRLHSFLIHVGNDGDLKPKPAPDLYLRALLGMGAPADQTLALEDSNSGVRAAHAAGLFVVAVPNKYTREHDFTQANLVVEDLNQVKDYLIKSI